MLLATYHVKADRMVASSLESSLGRYNLSSWWFAKFFMLERKELTEIAGQIDFDLPAAYENYLQRLREHVGEDGGSQTEVEWEFSGKNISKILKEEDAVKVAMPRYRYRKVQEDLALRVGQCFKNSVHGMIQAPTGTGKTLGYMLPSALYGLSSKEQVLVATGTKTLQNQAMNKDVPQLKKILGQNGEKLKVKRLVGSSNHLCELMFRERDKEEHLLGDVDTFDEKFSKLYFERIFQFNANPENETPITRESLPYVLKRKFPVFAALDKDVAVDFRACTGHRCPFKNECSYHMGIREAKDAHIIIGNHALMFSWPRGFARPTHVIVDEAHKIEGEATRAFTLEVSQEALEHLQKSLTNMQGIGSLFYLLAATEESPGESTPVINEIRSEILRMGQMLNDHLQGLPELFEAYFKKLPRFTDLYWNEAPMVQKASSASRNNAEGRAIYNHIDSLFFILTNLNDLLIPYLSRWEQKEWQEDNEIIAWTRFESFMAQVEDLLEALRNIQKGKEGYSHSMKFHAKHGYVLEAAPIDTGKILHDMLLQISDSVVFTSATLGNAHGDQGVRGVEWATGHIYLDPQKRFKSGLFLPATYDYKEKTKVFLCDDVPALYDRNFVPTVLAPVIALIKKLHGRSLLLFSAKKRFEEAREILIKEFEGVLPLFIQGMGNNVVEDFSRSGQGILLGMESFGEGIDVPGDALQFVFIDKIPDVRQDRVIQERRDFFERSFGNEFNDYYLAHRTRSLHQKLGRLLRTESDFGGVIVVDSRVKRWKGKTMEKMVKQMEPYQLERAKLEDACDEVLEFIEGQHHEKATHHHPEHSDISPEL